MWVLCSCETSLIRYGLPSGDEVDDDALIKAIGGSTHILHIPLKAHVLLVQGLEDCLIRRLDKYK